MSDKDTMKIVRPELGKEKYNKGVVLDGVPRNSSQAKALKLIIDRVIYLEVSDKECIKRLMLRRRSDDTAELIKERLRIYHLKTEPMLDLYQKKGVLERVDGERPVEEIHKDIIKKLKVKS